MLNLPGECIIFSLQPGADVGLAGLQRLTDESDSQDLQPAHTSITAQMMVLHDFSPKLRRSAAKDRWQLGRFGCHSLPTSRTWNRIGPACVCVCCASQTGFILLSPLFVSLFCLSLMHQITDFCPDRLCPNRGWTSGKQEGSSGILFNNLQ